MQRNCCHVSLSFILKLLNYLQTFVGVSMILYSVWMLNQWNHHVPVPVPPTPTPTPTPTPESPLSLMSYSSEFGTVSVSEHVHVRSLDLGVADVVSGVDGLVGPGLNSVELPAPWFIYSFMGVGIMMCCITLIGCIAAEAINGCCLCFYTLLVTIFILIEAALVAFIAIDRQWEKDLPFDPTGQLDNLRSFFKENADICEWVGITVVIIQALSLLLSIVLRAMVSSWRNDSDLEDGYDTGNGRIREPLLNQNSSQTSASMKNDTRGTHSDFWSSQIRQKYGLNNGESQSN